MRVYKAWDDLGEGGMTKWRREEEMKQCTQTVVNIHCMPGTVLDSRHGQERGGHSPCS